MNATKVILHFLGEQHGKGPVDQLFGWGCAWIENYIQEAPIYGLQDLLKCYKAGAQDMVNTDPDGPKFHIQRFDPGETRPQPRTFFQCPNFLVTRTYCLKADFNAALVHPIRLTNKVFTDANGTSLQNWTIEEKNTEELDDEGNLLPKSWRRGFWSGDPSWLGAGPEPGDVNEVVRRHLAQKHIVPPVLHRRDDPEHLLSQAASRLRKAATKKKRQTQSLRAQPSSSSSGSSSSSSSTSAAP